MILRIRSQVGQWRVNDVFPEMTIAALRQRIGVEHNVDLSDAYGQPLTLKPNPRKTEPPLPDYATIRSLKLSHGDELHLTLDESKMGMAHEEAAGPKKIQADGTIVQQSFEEVSRKTGFRPGRLSLKSIKMKWTLADFIEMDDQFTFKLKLQEKACCSGVTLDTQSCNSFQHYVRQFNFHRSRVGYLFGTFEEGNKVKVECLYEPPQRNSPEGFEILEDQKEETVENLAKLLRLKMVGWIFAHPPREEGFQFSSAEVIMAADLQLIAAQGVSETPFVTVKVTANPDGTAHFDAFQMSLQCMEMAAEGVLEIGDNPGSTKIAETFTAVVEAKATKEVDNNFFLAVVPIEQHDSERFVSKFPYANREGVAQTWQDVKRTLGKTGKEGFTYTDLLSDFQLLLFLTQCLDMNTDMPKICASVVDRSVPLDEGFKVLINTYAQI